MSGRIRTIKPELLEDAVTAGLSHIAFRLFIGCLLLADDYGNLRFELPWLRGQVFWAREVELEDFAAAVEELTVTREGASEPLLVPYVVKGQRYASIRGWAKHQRVQKPGKPRVPGRDESSPESSPTLSGESPETLRPDLRSPITDPERGSARAAARDTPTPGVAPLRSETDPPERSTPDLGPPPSPGLELGAPLDTPIPDAWRARGAAIVARTGVDFDLPSTWAKYVAACVRDRRRLTEAGWMIWAENEARFTAARRARRDDTAWGKLRPAVAEPGAPPYCAAARPPDTPDYDRQVSLDAAAKLASGAFLAPRKAAGS